MDEQLLEAARQVIEVTGPYYSMADLAAGDNELVDMFDTQSVYLGYLTDGSVDEQLEGLPYVHLFILRFQFRALPDPLATLFKIREKAARLLVIDWEDDKWSVEAITSTLTAADLQPEADQIVETPDGKFHVWLCNNTAFRQPDDEL